MVMNCERRVDRNFLGRSPSACRCTAYTQLMLLASNQVDAVEPAAANGDGRMRRRPDAIWSQPLFESIKGL